MAAEIQPEVVLYDLACTKSVCLSPVVWRIRLMLNYKRIHYKTVFLDLPDIEPTLKRLGIVPSESAAAGQISYTVPAIHHVPTNTYMMDSVPISHFLETTYPDPPLPLSSDLGDEIVTKATAVAMPSFLTLILPREPAILSPPAQEYFRRTREAFLGCPLEDLLAHDKQEQAWEALDDGMRGLEDLLRTNKAQGHYVLGSQPSYADFFIAGLLQSARVVDEEVFQRHVRYSGLKEAYDACLPYMEKED